MDRLIQSCPCQYASLGLRAPSIWVDSGSITCGGTVILAEPHRQGNTQESIPNLSSRSYSEPGIQPGRRAGWHHRYAPPVLSFSTRRPMRRKTFRAHGRPAACSWWPCRRRRVCPARGGCSQAPPVCTPPCTVAYTHCARMYGRTLRVRAQHPACAAWGSIPCPGACPLGAVPGPRPVRAQSTQCACHDETAHKDEHTAPSPTVRQTCRLGPLRVTQASTRIRRHIRVVSA